MTKLCAITGANGLVGNACCLALAGQGFEVRRLLRRPEGPGDAYFDLGADPDKEVLSGADVLIHCAYDFQAATWDEIHRVNVEGSRKLLQAAAKSRVGKIVYISSVSAFEGCRSLYGRGKMEVEKTAAQMNALIVRPGLVFGEPDRGMFGALNRLTALPLLPVFDGGKQLMALVHCDDLARLVGVMASSADETGCYVAAHVNRMHFRDILNALGDRRGKSIHFISIPGGLALYALRLAEALRIPLPFKSDSLVGLLNADPAMDLGSVSRWGVGFRGLSDD